MKIVFLCRWKLEDGLTVSTVMPHLKALNDLEQIEQIILFTLEEKASNNYTSSIISSLPKVVWYPLVVTNYIVKHLSQLIDHVNGINKLRHVIEFEKINLVVAHGAPAGTIADQATKGSGIPYLVSLVEPHAEYMLESEVWQEFGLKYLMQKRWEINLKKNAAGLMPVTEGYKKKLLAEAVSAKKIMVVPCSVYLDQFRFDATARGNVRSQLNWQKATIGIYVGKFGGLYYDQEAYQIYQQCFKLILDFRLIILSPQPQAEIRQQLNDYSIDLAKVYITSVEHKQVPAYLSAADFAFATYKPGPSKKYLSPVKIGEYWTNGLPVLLTEGIGDDSDIIRNEGGGALFNLQQEGSLESAIAKIQTIISDPTHRQEIPKLAHKYRSPEKIREAYDYFFRQLDR